MIIATLNFLELVFFYGIQSIRSSIMFSLPNVGIVEYEALVQYNRGVLHPLGVL